MKVTIILPFSCPSLEILTEIRRLDVGENVDAVSAVTFKGWGLWRLEIRAEGATILEALEDAARQYKFIGPLMGNKERLPLRIDLYLNDTESRQQPLQLNTPIEEGDVIDIRIHTG